MDVHDGVDGLFRLRRDASVRLAALLVGDVGVAEEIVQDAFLEVHRRWDELDNPTGYLRVAVVNRCRNHQRRRATARRRAEAVEAAVDLLAAPGSLGGVGMLVVPAS